MRKLIKLYSFIALLGFVALATPCMAAKNPAAWQNIPLPSGFHPLSAMMVLRTAPAQGIEAFKAAWRALHARPDARPNHGNGHGRIGDTGAGTKGSTTNAPSGVFASVAIPFRSLPSVEKWKTVYPAVARGLSMRCANSTVCATSLATLQRVAENASARGFAEKLSIMNHAVNRTIAYVPDRQNYGQLDYWATPSQVLANGRGDCEDYAILKMAALKAAGVPEASMSIVVVQDRYRKVFHAVLSVSTSQGHFILDNLTDRVMLDTAIDNYLPLYSVSAERFWIHGRKRGDERVASAARLPADMAPGEGIGTAAAEGRTRGDWR